VGLAKGASFFTMELLLPQTLRNPTSSSGAPTRAGGDPSTRFLLELARALHAAGAPSYRLEEALTRCASSWGQQAEFYSTPTSLFAAFGGGEEQRTYLLRVRPGDTDLGRLSELDELMEEVAGGRVAPSEGIARLRAVESAPARYGRASTLAAFAVVSATAAVFFGGSALDIGFSLLLGLVIGALGLAFSRVGLFESTAAFVAAALSIVAAHFVPGLSDRVTTLAGLIVLMPGLMLTVGLAEVSMTHWMSGTSRLAGSAVVFLSMAIGVALGRKVSTLFPGFVSVDGTGAPTVLAIACSLVLASLGFVVLFRARKSDVGWILLAGVGGFYAARFGAAVVGPELGSFVGALAIGMGSNAFARFYRRPASVLQLPGLLLLVPGSIGFQSLSSFLAQDVLQGVDAAFRMLFVGASLVGGLLLGNALVPPRRSL